jgi:succinyl-diaminopimelate desuccinylase
MNTADAISFLKQCLALPSVNGSDDEGKMAEFLSDYLRKAGAESTVQRIDGKHANVIARLVGKQAATIVWNGHLDTVPYGARESWHSDPAVPKERDGRIYARGASDMKSGLAGMVYVLGEIAASGTLLEKTIVFFGTCDEEKGGLGAAKILEAGLLPEAELLLIGEPTGCDLGVAQKGCIWMEVQVKGITSHASYPWQGANALEYGFRALTELKDFVVSFSHPVLGNATAQITMGNGGIAPNMVPDDASFLLDMRTVPGIDLGGIQKKWQEITARITQETGGRITFQTEIKNHRRALEIGEDNAWAGSLEQLIREERGACSRVGINYFTDASMLLRQSEMPVLLFGPGEADMAHKTDEYVEVKKYLDYVQILEKAFA